MSWQNEIGRMTRFLVDDIDSSVYSDTLLEEAILVSAQFVIRDIGKTTTYTIDVDTRAFTPDPTSSTPKDDFLINLTALKTACILLYGEVKQASKQAVEIVDGPSRIKLTGYFDSISKVHKDLCKEYETLLYKARLDISSENFEAITSPTTVELIGPRNFRNFN